MNGSTPSNSRAVDAVGDTDEPKEECGVVAISVPGDDAARAAFFGLYALQHRGQEAAGIAVADGRTVLRIVRLPSAITWVAAGVGDPR